MAEFSSLAGYFVKDKTAREAIKKLSGKPGYILLGDSFGVGVTPGVELADSKGWIYWAQQHMAHCANVYNAQVPLEGVYGFASSAKFKDVLEASEEYFSGKDISDIVVIAGTNDIPYSEADIKANISAFVQYCRDTYPKARIKIGCIGTNLASLLKVRNAYAACTEYGAEYIYDMTYLCCHKDYISSDNVHLTQEGYQFYSKWITNAIMTGHCEFAFTETTNLTNGAVVTDVSDMGMLTTVFTNGYKRALFTTEKTGKAFYSQKTLKSNAIGWKHEVFATFPPGLNIPQDSDFFVRVTIMDAESNAWKGEGHMYCSEGTIYADYVNYGATNANAMIFGSDPGYITYKF